ncbi:hypothetical protein GGF43_001831 [Coemansia sp. RSA 2618]|nr:hypothetical protein GGF43_001831 [Coemansia sp. RSA 2618]
MYLAQDSTSTGTLAFGLGNEIAASDFTFLADLIRMSESQSDSSLDSATVGSESPSSGSAEAGTCQARHGSDPAECAAPAVLSPSAVLAKSTPQFASALKPSQTSPLMFGSTLFGDITATTRSSETH